MPPPHHRPVVHGVAMLLGCLAVASCGAPPELSAADDGAVPSPSGTLPSATPTDPWRPSPTIAAPSATPGPTGFPESQAVSCRGTPTGAQVIALLRRDGRVLRPGVRVSVETGPLCSGTWQYTIVLVPGQEPLAVVTQGSGTSLRLVTAGTDVCSVPVRVEAPPGIRTAAACM